MPLEGGGRRTRAHVYEPRGEAVGVYVVAQGLHHEGPDDARLDRFLRCLAAAGFVTVAPFLSDFRDLLIAPGAADDLSLGVDLGVALARARGLPRPALFSVSFGSRPAIEIAAGPRGGAIGALVLFGGFADFDATVRFCVTGRSPPEAGGDALPHDPLNAPVVHLNLLARAGAALFDAPVDPGRLADAYREVVVRTWGRPWLKVGRAREPVVRDVAARLPDAERGILLAAAGLGPGGDALLERGLAATRDAFSFADPRPSLARVRPPVVIVHGRDDDVIPYTEAEKLARTLPAGHPHEVIVTGLYGHTGSALPGPGAVGRELAALARVTWEMARGPRRGPAG